MTKTKLSERNNAIDLLRVFCILYIVGYWHLFNYTDAFPYYNNYFTSNLTTIILGTFVFISGFLLSQKKNKLSWQEILMFYRKRIIRVYPLYLLALILFKLTGVTKAFYFDFYKAVLMTSMFYPPPPITLWFVIMIMIFYLIAPFLIYFAGNIINSTVFCLVVIMFFLLFDKFINPLDYRLILYFPAFTFGIILNRHKNLQNYCIQNQLILLFSLIPLFFLSCFKIGSSLFDTILLLPLILNGVLIFFVYANLYAARLTFNALVYFLSYSSFCMYLFHRLIFFWTTSFFFPAHRGGQFLYLIALSLPLTIMISWFIQKTYDTGITMANKLVQKLVFKIINYYF